MKSNHRESRGARGGSRETCAVIYQSTMDRPSGIQLFGTFSHNGRSRGKKRGSVDRQLTDVIRPSSRLGEAGKSQGAWIYVLVFIPPRNGAISPGYRNLMPSMRGSRIDSFPFLLFSRVFTRESDYDRRRPLQSHRYYHLSKKKKMRLYSNSKQLQAYRIVLLFKYNAQK